MPKATQRHTTKPRPALQQGHQDAIAADPVVELHDKMQGLLEAYNELDRGFETNTFVIKSAMRELFEAREAYETVVTFARATSIEGALLQLTILRDRVDCAFEGITGKNDKIKLEPLQRSIDRLLHSIVSALRNVAGDAAADLMLSGDFSPVHDPLRKIERGARGETIGELFADWRREEDA